MADLGSAIIARLKADPDIAAALDGRVHWAYVPQGAELPYVRMIVASDVRPENLKSYDSARQTRIRLEVFGRRYGQTRAIAETIISAFSAPATTAGIQFGHSKATGPRDLGEDTPDGFIHRASFDLLVEHSLA